MIITNSKKGGDQTMFRRRKNKMILKVFVILMSILMATAGFAADVDSSRIIPKGKVYVLENGKVVGEFSREMPLPEDSVLRCQGECSIKLDDVYMVAEPETEFSVKSTPTSHVLEIREGTIYYSLNELSRPITFNTPVGNAKTIDVSLTDKELKGYGHVSGNETELGVIRGGSITLGTESGDFVVESGKKVTMTMTYAGPEKGVPTATISEGMSQTMKITLGAVGAGVALLGLVALGSGSSGSDPVGSPSSP
jgi:hypothetical protein